MLKSYLEVIGGGILVVILIGCVAFSYTFGTAYAEKLINGSEGCCDCIMGGDRG